MISGAQVRNKTKTRRIRRQKSQTIVSCVNMSKGGPQTRANRPTKPRHRPSDIRTHQAVYQRRSVANGAKGGRPTPLVSVSRWVLAGSLILSSRGQLGMFPCIDLAGTDLKHYIRGLPPLSLSHTPLEGLSLYTLLWLVLLRVVELG